jgi:hypothetical protein
MLDTYIKNRGTTKTIVHNNNHNTINETNWDADYDGNVANVSLDLSKNGKNKHLDFKLTNDDLANMLSIPSVNKPIHKRLKMDFRKPESSFDKIFLELDPESSSDSDSDSSLENMDTLFDDNFNLDNFNSDDNSSSNVNPIQELLTHISSPKSNEEFIMPFQDYSLEQPVIKVVHKPRTSRKSSKKSSNKSRKFKHVDSNKLNNHKFNNHKLNNHKLKHHNYPSTRKSSKRKSSKRKSSKRRKSRSTYFF